MKASVSLVLSIFSGLILAIASFVAGTWLSAIGAFVFAVLLVLLFKKSQQQARDFYCCGLAFHLTAFYWLTSTLELFGGFPKIIAAVLYLVFSFVSALQFYLVFWFAKKLAKGKLAEMGLALPLSYFTLEFLFPRLFPWHLAHLGLAVSSFSGLAEFFGVSPLSGLLLWWAGAFLRFPAALKSKSFSAIAPAVCSALVLLTLGFFRAGNWQSKLANGNKAEAPLVSMVQGNLSAKVKGDSHYLIPNLETYRSLSDAAVNAGADLIIWPETVAAFFTPTYLENVSGTKYDVAPRLSVPLLYGGLGVQLPSAEEMAEAKKSGEKDDQYLFQKLSRKFNSGFGRAVDGRIVGIYHKEVLMPFGEYMPFADWFPRLKELSPNTGDFSKGEVEDLIVLESPKATFKIQALICYEDLVPRLSRRGVRKGANLLVNLTNDAWYGDTAAPHQHNLLAAFRAIETRRFLLRSTNTGVTAVIDPLGRTTAVLPTFSSGVLSERILLFSGETLYVKWGDSISWIIVVFSMFSLILRRKKD